MPEQSDGRFAAVRHPSPGAGSEDLGAGTELVGDGHELVYSFDTQSEETGIAGLLRALGEKGVDFKDLQTKESSLEEIFVNLVRARP